MLRLDSVRIQNGSFELAADIEIDHGSMVAVIGPSGAGKSTLINAIAGFIPLRSGNVLWQDQDLGDRQPGKRPIAMLFQDSNLFPHLSVVQNVGLGVSPELRLTDKDVDRIHGALDRVGLSDFCDETPATLSGGQQSRAALARVLVQAKPLILLDEPFAALGPALKHDMLDLVRAVVDDIGATLLMVSHDPSDARRIADHVVLVAEGRAHPPQPTAEILDNPPEVLQAYLGTG